MNNKKVILVILDGVGFAKNQHGNAIAMANTPTYNSLLKTYPHELIEASGEFVGLPEGQMGNSEVGHLNLGAGRVVYTGLSLINKAIKDKVFFKNEAFLAAIEHAKKNNSKLHIMGLVSHGGVHSSYEHIQALIELAASSGVKTIVHIFADGRDVDPKAMQKDIIDFKQLCSKNNVVIGSISGRYYSMDRDKRWERVQQAYNAIIGETTNKFTDVETYVQESYKNNVTDEFIVPAINASVDKSEVALSDNDAVIFANFRPDRARELVHCIYGSTYYDYKPSIVKKNIFMVTMSQYEGITPSAVAFPPVKLKNILGEVIEKNGLSQLRIAETEKYAHVTFFFDGGKEIDFQNEKKILVPSPKVATYDLKPSMSATEITEELIPTIGKFDVTILNFANGDMVGHTGNLPATIAAIECVDVQLKRIYEECQAKGVTMFILADHGNAEEMLTNDEKPVTKHTTNPVWFIVTDKNYTIAPGGKLANIAPSILKYLNINIPLEMDEKPIIDKKEN